MTGCRWRPVVVVLLAAALLAAAACGPGERRLALTDVPGGDADRGEAAMGLYGCAACHTIPGVAGANTSVGPPLTDFAYRQYIAGELTNTPDNLVRWIMDPQGVEPGTAMPNMGVTEADARDIAAYLASLK
jgi:cytochrome c1